VPGFGGAEIGLEGAEESTVARLLGAALDAGLNMINTAWIASRRWFSWRPFLAVMVAPNDAGAIGEELRAGTIGRIVPGHGSVRLVIKA
jgi:hypothetical protein